MFTLGFVLIWAAFAPVVSTVDVSSVMKTRDNHRLSGCAVHSQRTEGILECAHRCLLHSACDSFNYVSIAHKNGICELNKHSKSGSALSLEFHKGCTFGRPMMPGTFGSSRSICCVALTIGPFPPSPRETGEEFFEKLFSSPSWTRRKTRVWSQVSVAQQMHDGLTPTGRVIFARGHVGHCFSKWPIAKTSFSAQTFSPIFSPLSQPHPVRSLRGLRRAKF